MEQLRDETLVDAKSFVERLRNIGDIQEIVANLARERSRIETEEEKFMKDLMLRLAPALLPLNRDRSKLVIVRPSKRGEIVETGKLGSELVFRTKEGKIVPLTEHVDYKLFYNACEQGIDRESFENAAEWIQTVIDEIDNPSLFQ